LAHVPKEVIAKNFQVDISAFDHIPSKELYIFPCMSSYDDPVNSSDPFVCFSATPPPEDVYSDMVIPNDTPLNYTFPMSKMNATSAPGGSYKVVDTRLFPAATTICAAEVVVEVGGMRYAYF
jgi:oxalate decarboxylase/phosphoglucose isomerase-like protein (cupin superfamily)